MGEAFALLTGMVWSLAVVLFKRSGEDIPAFSLNLFRVAVSGVLLVACLIGSGGSLWAGRDAHDYFVLGASGIIGVAISDTLFHLGLNRVGAGINAIIDCLYAPSVVFFAFVLIGERIGPWQLAGMGLVVAGVVLTGRLAPPPGATARTLLAGIVYGVLAMVTLGLGIVIAKPILDRSSLLWVAAVRQVASLAVMLPVALALPERRQILAVFRPSRDWRFSLTGTLLGSFVAVLLWTAGMKYTQASIAAILNQTSTIYTLVLASLFLGETFGWRKGVATVFALAGILMVVLG